MKFDDISLGMNEGSLCSYDSVNYKELMAKEWNLCLHGFTIMCGVVQVLGRCLCDPQLAWTFHPHHHHHHHHHHPSTFSDQLISSASPLPH